LWLVFGVFRRHAGRPAATGEETTVEETEDVQA
jgi:hypothetical protein